MLVLWAWVAAYVWKDTSIIFILIMSFLQCPAHRCCHPQHYQRRTTSPSDNSSPVCPIRDSTHTPIPNPIVLLILRTTPQRVLHGVGVNLQDAGASTLADALKVNTALTTLYVGCTSRARLRSLGLGVLGRRRAWGLGGPRPLWNGRETEIEGVFASFVGHGGEVGRCEHTCVIIVVIPVSQSVTPLPTHPTP